MCYPMSFGALDFDQIQSKIRRFLLAVFFIAFHFSIENNWCSLILAIYPKMN